MGSNGVPFNIQRVKEFAIEKNKTGQIKCTYLYSIINTLNLSIILRFPEKSFISLRTPFHFKKCKQCLPASLVAILTLQIITAEYITKHVIGVH